MADSPLPADPSTDDARRQAAIDWLLSRINYERVAVIPYHERQLKLDRMRQLLNRLGAPDRGLPIVHIAGTKGKGSTAQMVASVLTAAGHRTGVYSSPHLEKIEERFAIDGMPCPAKSLCELVDRIRPVVLEMDKEAEREGDLSGPTFFDITTALALLHFRESKVDMVVLEVGLGGRLDSTNVCTPIVAVVTCIDRDHTKQLGETLPEIAAEKAGIIKPGIPVVSGVMQNAPQQVVADVAREQGCRFLQRGTDFEAVAALDRCHFWRETTTGRQTLTNLLLGLFGEHQVGNAAVAMATLLELRDQGWALPEEAIRQGLASARLPARVECFAGPPRVVVDSAHNEASARALVAATEQLAAEAASESRRVLIVSISRDKEVEAIARVLAPAFDRFLVTQYQENPRAADASELADLFRAILGEKTEEQAGLQERKGSVPANLSPSVEVCPTPSDAWRRAGEITGTDDLIVITGSFFIAAEMRPLVSPVARAASSST